jgi:Protein of unknown function (DUF3179)
MQRFFLAFLILLGGLAGAVANPESWRYEWPKTDFSKKSIEFQEILSGGPPKDGIPAIDDPTFKPVAEIENLKDTEPVIGLKINGEIKAYPLRILMWHEIVNDELGGVPVSVTFCPLCNAAIVFDRRLDGKVYDFGTTGKLRRSDLVMYDRQTESWWQQFLGQGIVGSMTGKTLKALPARLESWAKFKARAPKGMVLVPNNAGARAYGMNPYSGYDSLPRPFLYNGKMPEGIAPLSRVVSLEKKDQAWSLAYLKRHREVRLEDKTVIRWEPGQNSALDSSVIADGKDVGNVTVQRISGDGLVDIPYFVDFAFAFHAFKPESHIHK